MRVAVANVWLVEGNRFISGGGSAPRVTNPATQQLVEMPTDTMPDVRMDRYDAGAPNKRRVATAQELKDADLAAVDARADVDAREAGLLAIFGTVLEKFDPTWASMTLAQKKAAVNDMATRWAQQRRFVERNL